MKDITPTTLQKLFENQRDQSRSGSVDRMVPVTMPNELWKFVKEWCVPMLGAENYFPDLFGKYGRTFTGICDGWKWFDDKLQEAPEIDLWKMLAIEAKYWELNYQAWYNKVRKN